MSTGIFKAIARGVGYLLFFVAALVFFVYVTFPMDQVRGYVEYQAKKRMKMDVRIGDLALKGLGGVELWDVVIVLPEREPEKAQAAEAEGGAPGRPGGPAATATPGAEPAPVRGALAPVAPAKGAAKGTPTGAADGKRAKGEAAAEGTDEGPDAKGKKKKGIAVKIDHVDVTVKLLDVLFGENPDIQIDAELLGGSIAGAHISRDGKKIHIEAPEITGLDLTKTPLLGWLTAGSMPLDLRGKLSGSVDFTWGGSLWDSVGTIELTFTQSALKEPEIKSKQYGDLVLTDVKTGTIGLKVTVGKKKDIAALRAVPGPKDATVVHLEKVELSGDDVELVTEERSVFVLRKGKPFGDAALTVEIAFSLADGFFNREAVRNGEKEKPNKFLKYLVENDKKWKKAEKNGFYGLRCTGIAKRPDCNPVRPSMRVGFAKARGEQGEAQEKPAEDEKKPDAGQERGGPEERAPSAERRPAGQPRLGTAQDIEAQRAAREPAPEPELQQPKVPRIRTPATGVDPKVRIEQLKREREERLREMREARGLPPEPPVEEPILDEPLPDEVLVDEELPLDELPLEDGELPLEDELVEEPLPDEDDPLRRLRPEEMPTREEIIATDPDFDPER